MHPMTDQQRSVPSRDSDELDGAATPGTGDVIVGELADRGLDERRIVSAYADRLGKSSEADQTDATPTGGRSVRADAIPKIQILSDNETPSSQPSSTGSLNNPWENG